MEIEAIREKMREDTTNLMSKRLDVLPGNANKRPPFTIFRVPTTIRKQKANLFDPSVVSIGPFHHGNTNLKAMEEHKWWYLRDFLARNSKMNLALIVNEMHALEECARSCYSEPINLNTNEFVMMMVLDGCFILEYLLKRVHRVYDWTEVGWSSRLVFYDLILLENQIPFFIVEKLYELIAGPCHKIVPNELLKSMVRCLVSDETLLNMDLEPPREINHLLHLCHYYFVPRTRESTQVNNVPASSRKLNLERLYSCVSSFLCGETERSEMSKPEVLVIPCATELQNSGVKFKKKREFLHLLDVTFRDGVLEVPFLTIGDDSKHFFTNLAAFEQCGVGNQKNFGSFTLFMDSIINTPADVMILERCGIIENLLGSEEEVTTLFNQLGQFCDVDDYHYFAPLFRDVNRYYHSSWHRHRAKLMHDYFGSPWAVISLIAAIIFLVLTVVQTFFAVYAYAVPPKQL